MSDGSDIEWLYGPNGEKPATHNVVLGCQYRSRGCLHCYALRQARMRQFNPNPKVAAAFAGTTVHPPGEDLAWSGQVNLLPDRLDMPLHWDLPRFIFVNSMGEMFDDSVPEPFIAEEFAIIGLTPHHTYMLLTKCHARMRAVLTSERFRKLYTAAYRRRARELAASSPKWKSRLRGRMTTAPWPLLNLRLGVSAEDQETAGRRIPALLACAGVAGVLWVSAEPLVGPIDFRNLRTRTGVIDSLSGDLKGPDGAPYIACPGSVTWIVVGGESGTEADVAALHPDWARAIRAQCADMQVAFFFKQWGAWGPAPWRVDQEPGEDTDDYKARAEATCATHSLPVWAYRYGMQPVEAQHRPWSAERTYLTSEQAPVRRWGKHCAGRLLDGREYNEHPRAGGRAA